MGRISEFQIIKRNAAPALVVKIQCTLKDLAVEIEEAYEKLQAYLHLIDEFPAGALYVHYRSFSKTNVEMEVGFPVHQEMPGEEEVEPAFLVSGVYLTALHAGPHKQIPSLYREMDLWLEQNHFETTGVSEEIYLNLPFEKVAQEYLTAIVMIPIQKMDE